MYCNARGNVGLMKDFLFFLVRRKEGKITPGSWGVIGSSDSQLRIATMMNACT